MHDAVDEQRRSATHLARFDPAPEVSLDPLEDQFAASIVFEPRHVEPKLARVAAQVSVLERLLAVKEQLVHPPEPILKGGRLRRLRCGKRMRVDLGQREVPKREPDIPARVGLDALDRPKSLTRIRTLVIAV